MARTRSMTRNQNHDDEETSSSRKRPKSCAPWSDLDYDVLNRIMLRLGVVDFLFFCGVCKSWRSLALSNSDAFMASTPPVSASIITTDADEKACFLEGNEGRKFKTKTNLPHFLGGNCIGLTCGYLVFFMRGSRDLRLVNPITRYKLHFPDSHASYHPERVVLVFSASISKWVFVVLFKNFNVIWFSIAGEYAWNRVSYHHRICNLHDFKGKIYALTCLLHLSELRLGGPHPELTPLKIKQLDCTCLIQFVSSGDNFYGINWEWDPIYNLNRSYELDLGEMGKSKSM